MIDFRFHTFIEVCRTMNFTKAAARLNITQPAVSQHIKYIEDLYNVELFSFSGKKMFITDFGKLILNTVTTMAHDEIYMTEKIEEMKKGVPTVKIGVTLTIGEVVIAKYINKYVKKYPNSKIYVTVENTAKLVKKLDSGEIDFALVEGYFEKSEYDFLTYSTEPYIAVCAYNNKKFSKKTSLETLFEETLIVREKGSGTREILEKNLLERNYSLREFKNIMEIGNISTIKELVQSRLGITFLYETAVEKEIKEKLLKKIEIENFAISHDFNFIWRKNSIFEDSYKEFMDIG